MEAENCHHHAQVFIFPFMAHGHTIPSIDIAKLFASRGIKTTVITTAHNVSLFSKSIKRSKNLTTEIQTLLINLPCEEAGLPEGCESLELAKTPEMLESFLKAANLLEPQIDRILHQYRPTCLIADTFFPWTINVAAKYGIPTIVFHGTCFFSLCASRSVKLYQPHKRVLSDSEQFIIPDLPDEIKMTKTQFPESLEQDSETEFCKMLKAMDEAEVKGYGILVNSVYELEPSYADHYRNALGRKAWHIGPVSLCNTEIQDKVERGLESSIDEHECLKWLDMKKPGSVVYISFGTMASFCDSQLLEIAMAIEDSRLDFIWVVKGKPKESDQEESKNLEEWLPRGFEKRVEGKGLIIRGWAPQVLILEHEAIGCFMTHCGWNSTLEGVTCGVPMVTWPVAAEQFYNEKLVVDVLRIGVGVGAKKWNRIVGDDSVKREAIERAVNLITVGEGGEEIRRRAKGYGDMAKKAVEEGGSSYSDLNAFIEELKLK